MVLFGFHIIIMYLQSKIMLRSRAYRGVNKRHVIFVRLIHSADKLLQSGHDLNFFVLQVETSPLIPLYASHWCILTWIWQCKETTIFPKTSENGYCLKVNSHPTFVLMRTFLPPKVSMRDTPRSPSLQKVTG